MPCSYLQKDLHEWKYEVAVLYRCENFCLPFSPCAPCFLCWARCHIYGTSLGPAGVCCPSLLCTPVNSLVGTVHKPCSGIAKAFLYSFPVFSRNTEHSPTPATGKKITSSPAHSGNLRVWSSSGPSSVLQITPKASWQVSLSGIQQYLPYLTKVRSGYHQKIHLCQSRTMVLSWQFLCPKLQQAGWENINLKWGLSLPSLVWSFAWLERGNFSSCEWKKSFSHCCPIFSLGWSQKPHYSLQFPCKNLSCELHNCYLTWHEVSNHSPCRP